MAIDTLHKFEDDLRARPSKGSNAPPRSVRAKDLDENFIKTAVIAPQEEHPRYSVEYTREGTRLKIAPELPQEADFGALLYWNGAAWVQLSPPSGGLHVLTSSGGAPAWTATEGC